MTEGVEKRSRVEGSTGTQINDEGYPHTSTPDPVEENHGQGLSLSNEEEKAVDFLARFDFEYVSHDNVNLKFRRLRDDGLRLPLSPRRFFPRTYVRLLLGQLGDKVEGHLGVTGLIIPSQGYVELVCSQLEPATVKRVFQLESPDLDCRHKESANEMPSLPYHWPDEDGGRSVKRVHLSARNGRPCFEISNASPLAMLAYGQMSESTRARLAYPQIPLLITVKMAYDPASDWTVLAQSSEDAARSLIYELNVRNGVIIELLALPTEANVDLTRRSPEVSDTIRYPCTKVQNEVAMLFGFAGQVASDPPQAFLSYYQALECFIPTAIRQSAFKKIRRELRAPGFDVNNVSDASLLRIVKAAEGSIASAEPNQLRIVVNEYVRTGCLEEFFERDWGDYFTNKGPIKSVPSVNKKNTGQSLSDQVADRVYQIRNRIVHAKDDPKFGDARVLLPRSSEANALTPDVLLVRLLATEAISAVSP